ncbi:MAG: FAD-dependent oxidoreductase [Deltaproteobacteria bacterium]|nr:FAD-dependent oxidoreductase [Deltaproteobacteria bacterium]
MNKKSAKTFEADVVVVGGGVTGTYAAELFAKAGFQCILVDKQVRGRTGAHWINGVPLFMLKEAGLGRPPVDCLYGAGDPFILVPDDSTPDARIRVQSDELFDVDMRCYGEWFLRRAEEAGVKLHFNTSVKRFDLNKAGGPRSASCTTGKDNVKYHAKLFVDASGLAAVVRKHVPFLKRNCPVPQPSELCSASSYVYSIKDKAGARNYMRRHHFKAGEILAFSGTHGNFSIFRIQIAKDLSQVAFLTGTLAERHYPHSRKLLDAFIQEHRWVGSELFGGSRLIPIRQPYSHLVHHGVALLGDAACQNYTIHGSGIGIGLVAAKELVDAVTKGANARTLGTRRNLLKYERNFHRKWTGHLCSAEAIRRFVTGMPKGKMDGLLASGALSEALIESVLSQKKLKPKAADIAKHVKAIKAHPKILFDVAPLLTSSFLAALTPKLLSRLGWRNHDPLMKRILGVADKRKQITQSDPQQSDQP